MTTEQNMDAARATYARFTTLFWRGAMAVAVVAAFVIFLITR